MAEKWHACPYLGIRFMAITGLKFFMGTQKTIIYLLVVRKPCYDACFIFLIFWATFGGKMGVVITRDPNGLGSSNPTKKLAHWVNLLGQPLSRNPVFEIIKGEPPLRRQGRPGLFV